MGDNDKVFDDITTCFGCINSAKLLAVVFWFLLNALVLSVCLFDKSDLSEGLPKGEPVPRAFLTLVAVTGVLYMCAAFMDPGYLQKAPSRGGQDLTHPGPSSRIPPPPPVDLEDGPVDSTSKDPDANDDEAACGPCGWNVEALTGAKRDQDLQNYAASTNEKCCFCGWDYRRLRYVPESRDTLSERHCIFCQQGTSLRAKHCSSCGKCVARYDHHCIWLGNCVGERNHGLFWWYLVCQSAVIIWGLVYIWSAIKWSGFSSSAVGYVEGFVWQNGLKILIFVFILIWSWLPVCLLVYHSYLLCTNQTTWEFNRRTRITYLRDLPADHPNGRPFDGGIMHNLRLICCTPWPIFGHHPIDWRAHTFPKDVLGQEYALS